MTNLSPVVLVVLDGWGIASPGPGNAITQARLPLFNQLWSAYPHTQLQAFGEAVGLPHGEDGNTEVGHVNLGAGEIVYADLPRINAAIADGSFFQNQALMAAIQHVKKNKSQLHLLGLVGSGGVHANNEHLYALIKLSALAKVTSLNLHLITDGRDSPPTTANTYLATIENHLKQAGVGRIASIMGRYYGMDRDFRWERTEAAFRCLTEGLGEKAASASAAVSQAYQAKLTDEFIKPTNIVDSKNQPLGLISDNDAVIFYNFRVDRPRQLTKALVLPDFESSANRPAYDPLADKYLHTHLPQKQPIAAAPFKRKKVLNNLLMVTMTEYQKELPVKVVMTPLSVEFPLSRIIAEEGLRQLKMAETEKERFVTFYFNGLREQPFVGEDWLIVPSPKVATYDQKPEMSTPELTAYLLEKLEARLYQFVLINVAAPDMVGHTGNIAAAVKACEAAEAFLARVIPAVKALKGTTVITADHGNTEEMINLTSGEIDTEHSDNPVPFIVVNDELAARVKELPSGILADVAPTILKLLNLPQPQAMTGKALI